MMCDFENGLCDWKIENTNTNLWKILQGFTNAQYGPIHDHTIGLQKGHYLSYIYIKTNQEYSDGYVLG